MRLDAGDARIGVNEGAVGIAVDAAQAGDIYRFNRTGTWRIDEHAAGTTDLIDGLIVAHDMPLAQLVAELSRYRLGILRCDCPIANLPVSGSFQTTDTDRMLRFLADHPHLTVISPTRYWVMLSAVDST